MMQRPSSNARSYRPLLHDRPEHWNPERGGLGGDLRLRDGSPGIKAARRDPSALPANMCSCCPRTSRSAGDMTRTVVLAVSVLLLGGCNDEAPYAARQGETGAAGDEVADPTVPARLARLARALRDGGRRRPASRPLPVVASPWHMGRQSPAGRHM